MKANRSRKKCQISDDIKDDCSGLYWSVDTVNPVNLTGSTSWVWPWSRESVGRSSYLGVQVSHWTALPLLATYIWQFIFFHFYLSNFSPPSSLELPLSILLLSISHTLSSLTATSIIIFFSSGLQWTKYSQQSPHTVTLTAAKSDCMMVMKISMVLSMRIIAVYSDCMMLMTTVTILMTNYQLDSWKYDDNNNNNHQFILQVEVKSMDLELDAAEVMPISIIIMMFYPAWAAP